MEKMIEVKKFRTFDQELAKAAFRIREAVFVEEQNVDRAEEYDEFEDEAIHFLAYYNEVPVATARWRNTSKGIKLERFAVLKSYRGKGIGEAVLEAVLKDVPKNKGEIYLHAQVSALGFYEKNNFTKSGDLFEEANIQHYKMTYPQ